MLRIGSGTAKGRRLKSVTGEVRPTGSRVRGSLFDSIAPHIANSTVIDLCAGTGSLGIEALSRGARSCLFVEKNRRAVRMIKDNLDQCGFDRDNKNVQGRVWLADVLVSLDYLATHSCSANVILADPPYGTSLNQDIIRAVSELGLLSAGGILVTEHHEDDLLKTPGKLKLLRQRKIGETTLSFFQYAREKSVLIETIFPIEIPPPASRFRQ
tara:strand:- start:66058 stop:66693 length:636 start_codon:yes stop_codon:yes gene_type:complete